MNLVMHFGPETPPKEAAANFEVAVKFAQRYPCRVVALCPGGTARDALEGKLYSQCFIGEGREKVCSEALILGYPAEEPAHVANQASVWLEADLPVYHWLHRLPEAWIAGDFADFLGECRRLVVDSAVGEVSAARIQDVVTRPVRDLAYCRLLPVRQALGNYLSAVEPETLVEGLREVRVCYRPGREGEGLGLLDWMRSRLAACAGAVGVDLSGVAFEAGPEPEGNFELQTAWSYGNGHRFAWRSDIDHHRAQIEAKFGRCEDAFPLTFQPLEPAQVLAEALFF